VAILANIAGVDVAAVLSRRRGAVVTTDTVGGVICVVEIGGYPCSRRVTHIAGVVAGDMGCRLAGRRHTIMTAIAGAYDIRVIDPDNRSPGCIAMAIFAEIACLDVSAVLAGCRGTIMAT
jgi:hypothetical protein